MIRRALWLAWLTLLCATASAHEVRPAYLQIEEDAGGAVHILWKQPVAGEVMLRLDPRMSSGWLQPDAARTTYTESYLIREWTVRPPHEPLVGQEIAIDGLDRTLTDVLVRIAFADGRQGTHIINPTNPSWSVPSSEAIAPAVAEYVKLGVEHIWMGIDHLLFVLGLVLLVKGWRRLLWTVTAFTAAHSITLAASVLDVVHVPQAPVEAVIALSILYLAVELANVRRGGRSFTHEHPWVVALAFGLLHGFGFAGALAEVGLPHDQVPLALLLFNVGIEIGQALFIAVVLVLLRALALAGPRIAYATGAAIPHVIGGLAAFWLIERTFVP
jgi:hydrogenase/urease accessory protein HupE